MRNQEYFKHLMAEFDRNLVLVLAAYNAGPSAVRSYQGIPPFAETREYIRQVLQFYRGGGCGSLPSHQVRPACALKVPPKALQEAEDSLFPILYPAPR